MDGGGAVTEKEGWETKDGTRGKGGGVYMGYTQNTKEEEERTSAL